MVTAVVQEQPTTTALDRRHSLLIVVQRYGTDVSGGAETHARDIASRMRPYFDVEVATTTARDYWTWANEYSAGLTWVEGIRVHRFPVVRQRARFFHAYARRAFRQGHTLADEHSLLDAQGPVAPDLIEFIYRHGREFDHVLFFTYIYWPTVLGLPIAPERAVLVPLAHDEPAIIQAIYRGVFHLPRAIAYNSLEEREMVWRIFGNRRIPSDILGVGTDAPPDVSAERFRKKHQLDGPLFMYVGRVSPGKACDELFDLWSRWRSTSQTQATLVLAGTSEMPIPRRGDVRHLGRIDEQDKYDGYAAATAVIVPSRFESLSAVVLQAWAVGRPSLCPGWSPVVSGMVRRAGGGLPYHNTAEFAEICELLIERPELAKELGRRGRDFLGRTYTWDRIVETYLDIFAEVRTRNAA